MLLKCLEKALIYIAKRLIVTFEQRCQAMKKERDVRTWTKVMETGTDGQPVLGGEADYEHIFLAKFPYPGKITITILGIL